MQYCQIVSNRFGMIGEEKIQANNEFPTNEISSGSMAFLLLRQRCSSSSVRTCTFSGFSSPNRADWWTHLKSIDIATAIIEPAHQMQDYIHSSPKWLSF